MTGEGLVLTLVLSWVALAPEPDPCVLTRRWLSRFTSPSHLPEMLGSSQSPCLDLALFHPRERGCRLVPALEIMLSDNREEL